MPRPAGGALSPECVGWRRRWTGVWLGSKVEDGGSWGPGGVEVVSCRQEYLDDILDLYNLIQFVITKFTQTSMAVNNKPNSDA